MRLRNLLIVPISVLVASFQNGAAVPTASPRVPVVPRVLASPAKPAVPANAVAPSTIKDEHLKPITGPRVVKQIPNQMPLVRPSGRGGAARIAGDSLANAFLTRPYLSYHMATSVFDHCNPDYSLDGKVCRTDGAIGYSSYGVDPSFSKGYAATPGAGDYIYYDGHNGWDLALAYENIRAAAGGTVQIAGTDSVNPCFGTNIVINHPNGLSTRYAHLSQVYVSVGQAVDRGQVIGQSGNTGCSSGAHLHFGVYVTSSWTAIDPFGWTGSFADPWPADIGDLWLTGNPADPLPSAPLGVTATPANSSAVVSWQPPAFDGGLPVSTYTVMATPGNALAAVAGGQTTATVNGLSNGTTYTFTVLPTNSVGNGYWSAPSNGVVPTSVPRSPLNVSASPANYGVAGSWSPPSYDGGSPVTGYTVTASPGGASVTVSGGARSATVPGLQSNQTYTLTVVATNVNGNSAPSAPSNPVVPYGVHAIYTLDAWGGIHADAASPPLQASAYWPNQNRARSAVLLPDGSGGYVLDQTGGLHPFGAAGAPWGVPSWPNSDLARDVVLLPGATASQASGYTLDAWGGLHPFGGAPPAWGYAYWPNTNLAKRVVLLSDGTGGYTMDAWGGLHAFAVGANALPPAVTNEAYWPNWNMARDIVLTPGSTAANVSGVTLDGWGGLHPFGSAAPTSGAYWPNWDIARAIRLAPASTAANPQGWVLDAWGGLHAFGGAPTVPSGGYWPNTNLAVQMTAQ
ncbi:MAG: peptidoglycan DD-metalloendopeptidase family protein [Candidatus Dormibacteraeota bacterium]|nr:peptidoglycan DD-metalloendopeptidase family protein [Candidatus Dormibacteraeota bacterium]